MKYILKDGSPLVKIDEDTFDIDIVKSQREAIGNIYLVDEPGILTTNDGDVNMKSGDIVIRFYESKFPKKVIVVKSKDWKNNLKEYNDTIQKEKEEWALRESCDEACCPDASC